MPPRYIFFLLLVFVSFQLTESVALAQCTAAEKQALYQSFLNNRTTDQARANEDAKKYLACPTSSDTEAEQKIFNYLKAFTSTYDQAMRKLRFKELLYNERKYAEAYALAKQIFTTEPEDFDTLIHAGANGYLIASLNDAALVEQVRDYANRALKQLDAGKALNNWYPLSRDSATAYNNYTAGTLSIAFDPETALNHLIAAVQFDTPLRKSAYTFAYIAGAYEIGDYAKLSEVYKRNLAGKQETLQSKLLLANINEIIDRMIDGYARAVALAGSDSTLANFKAGVNESLVKWYKFRNNDSDAGLSDLIGTILTKPLPSRPTPMTISP